MKNLAINLNVFALLVFSSGLLTSSVAFAERRVEAEIARKNTRAMETYDLLEYEEARSLLTEAIALAKRHDIKTEEVAKAYLNLAIVYYSGFQEEAIARMAMIDAVEIDENIEIDRAYRTKQLDELLQTTKREFGKSTRPEDDCDRVMGIRHVQVDTAPAGTAQMVEVAVGRETRASRVVLSYRQVESRRFSEVEMRKVGECGYVGIIPGDAVLEPTVHYYIRALNDDGRVVAARGEIQAPIIVEVKRPETLGTSSDEDPLGREQAEKRTGPLVFLLASAGTGGGIVTGTTEQTDSDVGCCLAPSLFNAVLEIGYLITNNFSVSGAFRYGVPLGANIPGHATGAVAFFGRVRYGIGDSLDGLQIIGSIGGGLLRHTINLEEAMAGQDVDTAASGPFIIGPGVGYWFHAGGPLRIFLELHALAAVPAGIDTIGNCPETGDRPDCIDLNFGLQLDANIGLAVSF